MVLINTYLASETINTILVLPFHNETVDGGHYHISDILQNTITVELQDTNLVNVVPHNIANTNLARMYFKEVSFKALINYRKISKITGADIFIFGKYKVIGNTIEIMIHAVNVHTREVIAAVEEKGVTGVDIFPLLMKTSQKLVAKTSVTLDPGTNKKRFNITRFDIKVSPVNKAGISLLCTGLVTLSAGMPLLIYDLSSYSSRLRYDINYYRETGNDYSTYYQSYHVFIGLFVSSVVLTGLGLICIPISIPLIVYKKKKHRVTFNISFEKQPGIFVKITL